MLKVNEHFPSCGYFIQHVFSKATTLSHPDHSSVFLFKLSSSLYCLLTASFSGLQAFTHRMWSNNQSMGLSLWNIRKNSAIIGRSRARNILPKGLHKHRRTGILLLYTKRYKAAIVLWQHAEGGKLKTCFRFWICIISSIVHRFLINLQLEGQWIVMIHRDIGRWFKVKQHLLTH